MVIVPGMRTPEDALTDPDQLIRLGTIASVDQAAGKCTVALDTGVVSPPLRWLERRSGATKTRSVPTVGEQVILLCPAGEISGGIVLTGVWSTAHPLPGTGLVELIDFSDGAMVSYDPVAHALAITLPAGATAAITAPGGVTITGDVRITGDATIIGTVNGQTDVIGGGKSLKGHIHTGVTAGTAITGAPQ